MGSGWALAVDNRRWYLLLEIHVSVTIAAARSYNSGQNARILKTDSVFYFDMGLSGVTEQVQIENPG